VPIGPDRWLVAVVIDGHTKDNLQNICHRTGRNVSQRIALLINRAADTRKRHQ
jgi:antitoxin component of RelBE/YafQ-DinJ toxin-antitoxin module